MYTKYIWGGQQTEMKILVKQNSTHPLKETFAAQSALSAKCYIVQVGVHSADTNSDYSKSHT